MNLEFKNKDLEFRKKESDKIKSKYPNRIPIIVFKDEKSKINDIDKHKYLCPNDLTIGQFMYVIRKRIKLNSDQALFFFVNDSMPSTGDLLSIVYSKHKDDDGFLYITYSGENTFG